MLCIDGIIFRLQSSGGISTCFRELILAVAKQCTDYRLLSYGGNHSFDETAIPENRIIQRKGSLLPLVFERYLDVSLSSKTSVFHSSYYRIPKQRSVKTITTVHDFTYERYSSGFKKAIHHRQKRRAVLNSDVVVCISESTRNDLFYFIPEARSLDVRVVLNGVSSQFYLMDEAGADRKFVLYVGARAGYKNFSSLVHALSMTPSLSLISVGGGALTEQEKILLERCLPGRYKHNHFVSDKELNSLYNRAFCFVYPSLYEGFGIPVLEAMKAGCPVIAANSSSLPEVCGDAAVLLDHVNPDTIAKAIDQLSATELRTSLIAKGLKNASAFSWEENVKNIMNIYKETEGIFQ